MVKRLGMCMLSKQVASCPGRSSIYTSYLGPSFTVHCIHAYINLLVS